MAYAEKVKEEILQRIENGDKIKDISKETGIAISTLYNWRKNANSSKKHSRKDKINESIDKEIEKQKKRVVKELSSEEENFTIKAIEQSKIIKRLIKEKRFETAKKIGYRFLNNAIIQSQMVTIAIKEGDLKRAKEIEEKFPDNEPIQSQMITIAIKEEDFKKAKKIGDKFPDNETIQSQMVTIAIEEGDLKRAKEIGEKFPNNEIIKKMIEELQEYGKIFEIEEEIKETKEDDNLECKNQKKRILDSLKTKLYYNKIDNQLINEIESNEDLNEFEKIVSLLAICEKRNMKGNAKEIVKTFNTTDKKEKSIINEIIERIQSKKAQIFDITKYDSILQWSFDKELRSQYEEELKKEREERAEQKIKTRQISQVKKMNNEGSMPNTPNVQHTITDKKSSRSEEYRKKLVVTNPKKIQTATGNNKEKKVNNKSQIMIDYIQKFIQEQRKRVYVQMQSQTPQVQADAISKWDRIEILLDKIAEKSTDTQYIEKLYNRVIDLNRKHEKEFCDK